MSIKNCIRKILESSNFGLLLLDKYREFRYGIKIPSELLSVIIPSYNTEQYIERCLESLRKQSYKKLEVIIIDDCSTDSTREKIKEIIKLDSRFRLIEKRENTGSGESRNIGIRLARGKFITFVDSDDFIKDPSFFAKSIQKLKKEKAQALITPYLRLRNGKINKDRVPSRNLYSGDEACRAYLARQFGTHASCGKFFMTDVVRGCQYVECGYSQDVIFTASALKKCKRVVLSKDASYVYNNENVSAWRPTRITDLHVYSSFRLLLEILAFNKHILKNDSNDTCWKKFLQIWNREHGKRLKAYVEDVKGEKTTFIQSMVNQLIPIKDLLEVNVDDKNITKFLFGEQNDDPRICISNIKALRYLKNQVSLLSRDQHSPTCVIFVSHLRNGGLERVATDLSFALKELGYNVYFILNSTNNIAYPYYGEVVSDKSERAINLLAEARYIFDFVYKVEDHEYPLLEKAVAEYHDKFISTIHNTKTCSAYFDKTNGWLNGKKVFAVACVSDAVKRSFVERYGVEPAQKIEVLHNYINLDLMHIFNEYSTNSNDDQKNYFLFAGRLNQTEHKGLDLLIDGYIQSKVKTPLYLVGGGKLESSLLAKIENSEVKERIIIKEFSNNIYQIMQDAKCLVCPSRWEGFSMVHLEALANGTPVLTSKSGGAEEVIQHKVNGYLFDIDDINGLIDGLRFMDDHYTELRENCAKSVFPFSKDMYVQKLKELLNSH